MTQQDSRSTGRFDSGIYEGALQAFLSAGAPENVAENAARVIGSDDPHLDNFGRTTEGQDAVQQGWFWLVFGTGIHDIGLPQEIDQ